jgi:hypothetical protein
MGTYEIPSKFRNSKVAKVFKRVYAIWTRRSASANCSPENANLKKGNNSFIKFPKYIKIYIIKLTE